MLILLGIIVVVTLLCLTLADDGARYLLVQLVKAALCFGGAALSLYILFIVLAIRNGHYGP